MKIHLNLIKLSILICCMILLSLTTFATDINISENLNADSFLGNVMDNTGEIIYKSPLSDGLKALQETNADGSIQLGSKEQIFAIKKLALLDMADDGWSIILALFKLVYESIVLLMYVIEMRLILYLLVDLIPSVFIKIKNAIANQYLERRK